MPSQAKGKVPQNVLKHYLPQMTYEPGYEISNNVVCANKQSLRSACAYTQSDQSLCLSLEYSVTPRLQSEQHLEFLSCTGGCTGSSESTLVKRPHCWKSLVTAHIFSLFILSMKRKNARSVRVTMVHLGIRNV